MMGGVNVVNLKQYIIPLQRGNRYVFITPSYGPFNRQVILDSCPLRMDISYGGKMWDYMLLHIT